MKVKEALAIAEIAHKGQKRKGGADYITHPLAVCEIAVNLADRFNKEFGLALDLKTVKKIALLHDVVEDSDVTLKDLKKAGLCKDGLKAVDAVTKRKGEEYHQCLKRIAIAGFYAITVKLADLKHNSSDLRVIIEQGLKASKKNSGWSAKSRLDKYNVAILYLMTEFEKQVIDANQ